jgi:hypothetical protein
VVLNAAGYAAASKSCKIGRVHLEKGMTSVRKAKNILSIDRKEVVYFG